MSSTLLAFGAFVAGFAGPRARRFAPWRAVAAAFNARAARCSGVSAASRFSAAAFSVTRICARRCFELFRA